MAMLIAWQTINAVRRPQQQEFHSRLSGGHPRHHHPGPGFGFSSPTTRDSYYQSRELIPNDMIGDLDKARIVITNFSCLQAQGTDGPVQGRPVPSSGAGATPRYPGDRGTDASAGHARIDGHEAYPGAQRRGPTTVIGRNWVRRLKRNSRGMNGRRRKRTTTRPPASGSPGWKWSTGKLGISQVK